MTFVQSASEAPFLAERFGTDADGLSAVVAGKAAAGPDGWVLQLRRNPAHLSRTSSVFSIFSSTDRPAKRVKVLWDVFSAIMEALNPTDRRQPPEPPQQVEPEEGSTKQKERKDRGVERGGGTKPQPRGGKRR